MRYLVVGCVRWIDYSLNAPLEQTLYTVLNMWLAGQRAGGGWQPKAGNQPFQHESHSRRSLNDAEAPEQS